MTVWTAGATVKVRPGDPAPTTPSDSVRISAAGNEFEAFQVVVTGTARNVRAVATQPTSGGATLPAPRLYREGIINLQRPSSSDPESQAGPWPDALVPDVDELDGQRRNAFPFTVRGASQGIWVEVFVPERTPAGDYTGTVTISADGQPSRTVAYTVRVWNFDLPATASAKSAFALAYGALPTAFGFDASDLAAFSALRHKFGVMGIDHRVSLSRFDDGVWYDLDHFAAAYGPLMTGDYAGSSVKPRLSGARITSVEYLGPPSGKPGYSSDPQLDMDRWASFYEARGWRSRLFQYTADEPNDANGRWAGVPASAAVAHGATDPSGNAIPVRTLVTTTLPEAIEHGDATLVDVIIPAINFMAGGERSASWGSGPISSYDTFLAYTDPANVTPSPPNELWLYQSCMSHDCGGTQAVGWPSYVIDALAVRNRAMQWLVFAKQATGELYWETGYALYAKRDAWTDQWAFTGNGDGTLFYPGTPAKIGGTTNIPVASIRLKMIREGMEDFEYLTKLAGFGAAARQEALDVANAQFPDAHDTGYAGAAAALMRRREYLACRILEYQADAAAAAVNTACPNP